ncbi:hypothetical protein [Actinocrispum wychmicini]|uniref:hypothetical protein n=1 Tax=Actinocrispum wychmicini TaxID=1213861 RepID=UPI00104FEA93|nr:hypothetical protein [Actinocrispum wychmicini]
MKTFLEAWDNPAATRYELPAIDVNEVLAERYQLGKPLVFTRTMLWDLEVRKARRPDLFIPFVVASGSAESWGEGDIFVRKSMQRLWTQPDTYGLVLEQTQLDHANQIVTFIGATELAGSDGEPLRADSRQPVFHVQHSVGGTENQPLNLWRIVHLTDAPDSGIIAVFDRIAAAPWLPEFIEIYVRDVLGISVTRSG